jgi:hypothetical protein
MKTENGYDVKRDGQDIILSWSTHSSDHTAPDIFLWSHLLMLKCMVVKTADLEELKSGI